MSLQMTKVIMVDVSDLLDSGLTGVVAIKIAEQYNKPCILLKKHFDMLRILLFLLLV